MAVRKNHIILILGLLLLLLSLLSASSQSMLKCSEGIYDNCISREKYEFRASDNYKDLNSLDYCAIKSGVKYCMRISPFSASYLNDQGKVISNLPLKQKVPITGSDWLRWDGYVRGQSLEYNFLEREIKEKITIKSIEPKILSQKPKFFRLCSDYQLLFPFKVIKNFDNIVFKSGNDIIFFISEPRTGDFRGFYDFEMLNRAKFRLCSNFELKGGFPMVLDPSIDQTDISTFTVVYHNDTEMNITGYDFSYISKYLGYYTDTDLVHGLDLCENVVLNSDIVSVYFVSNFSGWLDLADRVLEGFSSGSDVDCNGLYFVDWEISVNYFDNTTYKFEFVKQ